MSSRFGYAPKMFGAAFVGYFTGKLSYQNVCAEKLMQLPDSPVGEVLRKRKGRLGFQETCVYALFTVMLVISVCIYLPEILLSLSILNVFS